MAQANTNTNYANLSGDALDAFLASMKSSIDELKAGQATLKAELETANKEKNEAKASFKKATDQLEAQLKADADKTLWQKAKENWMTLTGAVAVGVAAGAAGMYYANSNDSTGQASTSDM